MVARGQPCMIVGDFNVEPTKIPCLAKGISAGLWVDLEESWALTSGLQPAPTCKRDWCAAGGHRRVFMVGCPLAAAAALSCKVQQEQRQQQGRRQGQRRQGQRQRVPGDVLEMRNRWTTRRTNARIRGNTRTIGDRPTISKTAAPKMLMLVAFG